jgi:DNA replication and repair protein RecF
LCCDADAHLIYQVRLKKFSLRQFRNINEIEINPDKALNVFIGENAQGKTSLLEGIYFLSTLKSFRPGKLTDLTKVGSDRFQVEGILNIDGVANQTTDLKVRFEELKKKTYLNEKLIPAGKFISTLRVVVFSPDSLAAIKYGPELRRELIDQAVFQISKKAAQAQEFYAHAVRQRNACLKQIKNGILEKNQGREVLGSLEPAFLRLASEVTYYRLEFLDSIKESMAEIVTKIMGTTVNLDFAYKSEEKNWEERGYSAIHDRLLRELEIIGRRASEEAIGLSLVGPHRHDLAFVFNQSDSRIYCSQGQQRALILSFKMAEIVYHGKAFDSYPLLLLDDVLSEFDEKKQNFLVDFLRDHEAQTFLTTTDQTQILSGCQMFHLTAGTLKNLDED